MWAEVIVGGCDTGLARGALPNPYFEVLGPVNRIFGKPWAYAFVVAALLLGASVPDAAGQIPTNSADALRLIQENPDLLREQLIASGMSEEEIRARLVSEGYPADLLDGVLAGDPIDPQLGLDPTMLSSLESLGIVTQGADGLEFVDSAAGMSFGEDPDSVGFPVFGHEVFTRASSLFQPLLSGPVSEEYRLGPGDRLTLILTGEAERSHELVVTREGFVVVPQVGRISVANVTMAEARTVFTDRLARFYSGIRRGTTTVTIAITELRAIQVYVTGAVVQAGAFQISSAATATNALYAAGGPTEIGSLRSVRIQRRDGSEVFLDLYPYLLEGETDGDIPLQEGDVIFVPRRDRRVQLHGAIVQPAQYDLSATDDLIDVLDAAGGFAPDADRRRLTVYRFARPGDRGPGLGDRQAVDIALRASSDASDRDHLGGVLIPPVGLQDGDSIVVGTLPELEDGYYVTVTGQVAAPDRYPWREGMTLRELVDLARGPIVGADLREAEVSRLPDERGLGELADRLRVPLDSSYLAGQLDAEGRFVGPPGVPFPPAGSAPEFTLLPYDQVMILRQPDFEMPQSVQITGQVSVPGEYTLLTKSDRVTDLIARSGRVLENGHLEGARLHRKQDDLGRIDLDLPMAMASPGSTEDIILQPGDSLDIPVYSPTVQVVGAVNSSSVAVLYREGQDVDYYISAAGGYRFDADKGRTSVRLANGLARTRSRFLFWTSFPEPDAGSVITVPAKEDDRGFDFVAFTTNLVAIVGSIATVVIVSSR